LDGNYFSLSLLVFIKKKSILPIKNKPIMEHELKYDKENEIVVLSFKYHFLQKDVDPLFLKVKEMLEGKLIRQMLVVMSEGHNVENRETREATSEQLSKLNITEVAFVGGNATNRMIARVLLKTGVVKLNGDFFKDYEEAIKWLKSKR
jgi:hypothetical protein